MPLVGAARRRVPSTTSHQAMEIKTYNKSVSTVAFQSKYKKHRAEREDCVCKSKTVNCNWKYGAYVKVKFHVFYFICKFEFNSENNFISIIIIEARTIILCVLKFFFFFFFLNFIEFQSFMSAYVIFVLYHFKNNLY